MDNQPLSPNQQNSNQPNQPWPPSTAPQSPAPFVQPQNTPYTQQPVDPPLSPPQMPQQPPAPVASPIPPIQRAPAQLPQLTEMPATPPTGNNAPKKKRRLLWVSIFFVIVLIAAGVGVYFFVFNKSIALDNQGTISKVQSLTQANQLDDVALAKLNQNDLFFGAMYAVATQSIQHLKSERTSLPSATSNEPTSIYNYEGAIDYGTNKIAMQWQNRNSFTDKALDFDRCIGDAEYQYFNSGTGNKLIKSEWEAQTQSFCKPTSVNVGLAILDGINAGGLTPAQANLFIADLNSKIPNGLIKVEGVSVATQNNKKYIKIHAKVNSYSKTGSDGKAVWTGLQEFIFSFRKTGVDINVHPYRTAGVVSAGMDVIMYVDPQTLLPAYGEYLTDTGVDEGGKPQAATDFNVYNLNRVEYVYGGTIPVLDTASVPQPLRLTWPAEKR